MYYKRFFGNRSFKFISLAALLIFLASCGVGRTTVSRKSTTSSLQNDILDYSKQFLGKPYRYAGKGPNSFDCSGFTSFVFKKFGYKLNSSSSGQDRQFPTIAQKDKLEKGDLVFFEGSRRNGRVGHVGIVADTYSNGEFRFIHASTTNGVIFSESTEPYYSSRYLRGGRVIDENSYTNVAIHSQPKSTDLNPRTLTHTTNSVTQNNTPSDSGLQNEKSGNPYQKQEDPAPELQSNVVLRKETTLIPPPTETHVVQQGETLYSISKKYNCSVEQLKRWNPQLGPILKAGEKIKISVSSN